MTDPISKTQARDDALRRAARERTERATAAAEAGIRALIKDGGQISFQAVSRAAGVSTKFLHQHPDLSTRIRDLRQRQRGAMEASHETAAEGESAVIAALRRQLREQEHRRRTETTALRDRVKELERQVAVLHGRLLTRG